MGFGKRVLNRVSGQAARCPYCKTRMDPIPQRKKKCPGCGKSVFVRHTQEGRRFLFTETEVQAYEARKVLAETMHAHGFTPKEKEDVLRAIPKDARAATIRDATWRILNRALVKAAGDWHTTARVYSAMAWFLWREGKDARQFLVEACRADLRAIAGSDKNALVRIMTNGTSACEVCRQLSNQVLPVSQALVTMPIPHPECRWVYQDGLAPFCRCSYLREYEREWVEVP